MSLHNLRHNVVKPVAPGARQPGKACVPKGIFLVETSSIMTPVLRSDCFLPQIPPTPPKPDFDEPRHKLAKLREGMHRQQEDPAPPHSPTPPHTTHLLPSCTHPATPPITTPPTPLTGMPELAHAELVPSWSRVACDYILSMCSEGEEAMTKEEYTKMKQELEA